MSDIFISHILPALIRTYLPIHIDSVSICPLHTSNRSHPLRICLENDRNVNCLLRFPNIPNKHKPNRPFFCSCSSRTEHLGVFACSVRDEHEQNRGSVRFCSFRTMPLFCSASNRTNRTNSNLHCSASHLWVVCSRQINSLISYTKLGRVM